MKSMLKWFEETRSDLEFDPFIRSGIIHLWFLTIHPFEDGNGRLARIVSELALAQYDKKSSKLYSVSSVILDKRKEYYFLLEQIQKGGLDITKWLAWYLEILKQAIHESLDGIEKILYKTNFWKTFHALNLLPEQKKILNLMLDSKNSQFDNGISAMQYQKITKVSKATATRHLAELVAVRCLKKLSGGGRNTRYALRH
jgi:Fic family protein